MILQWYKIIYSQLLLLINNYYVFTTDVVKMYRPIKSNHKHPNLQCILWRYSPE